MSQTAELSRRGTGFRSLLATIACALLSISCSSIEPRQNITPTPGSSIDSLYSLASESLNEDPDEVGYQGYGASDADSSEPLLRHADAELQSDFQYLYNRDIADPYQRVLGISRGHLGMLSITPPGDPARDMWLRMRNSFQFDLSQSNARIESELNRYISNPLHIERTVERARRYIHYIVEEIERRDMPMELALLPVVESAFQPFAHSHAKAAGLWQFIPSTGRLYGLHQNWWYDGRRDVIASTNAALNYLQNLADIFDGDWMLALASYNCGAGAVMRAIRYNEERGLPTDFWNLKLPRETQAYVPKLLAVAKLVKHPDYYDMALGPLENEPYFEIVDIGSQIDLAQAAELAEIEVEELYHLNPAFNQWATSPFGPHRLLIPRDSVENFRKALANVPPEKRTKWTRYAVERGDSLQRVAVKFNTTPEVLRQVNKLRNNVIRIGQKLLIPVAFQNNGRIALTQPPNTAPKAPAKTSSPATGTRVEYVVKSGDTWWDLAQRFQVNVRQLASWNKMSPKAVLMPGKKLVIHAKTDAASTVAALAPKADERKAVRKVGYRVRSGDSLYRIANRFNVSVQDIANWNDLNTRNHLRPGQKLDLFVDVTRTN